MHRVLRPVSLIYLLIFVAEVALIWFVAHQVNSFESRTVSMREGYLNEVTHMASGTISQLAQAGMFNQAGLSKAFENFESMDPRGYYDAGERRALALHLTVTDPNGMVLYDSNGQGIGSNISSRSEVLAALNDAYQRRDEIINSDTFCMFVALPIKVNGRIQGVVVASKTNEILKPLVNEAKRSIQLVGVAAEFIVFLIIVSVFLIFLRPLELWFSYTELFKSRKHPLKPNLRRTRFGIFGEALDHIFDSLSHRRYIEHMMYCMAHEMRNPVASIQSSAELLERDLPTELRQEAIRDIKGETGRMSQTINKLLNIAALEKRNSLKELPQIAVRHILDELDDRFRNVMADRGIALSIDAPEGLKIFCDPDLLVQALGNLIQNSIDHSDGGTRIDLFVFEQGNKIEFQVIDQGEGIPEYALPHLFDKFYSIKAKGKGTGLGLSLVLEVADLHYGAISIKNHDSGGVIAILTIAK